MKRIVILFSIIILAVNTSINAYSVTKQLKVAIIDPVMPAKTDPSLQIGVREIISACFVNNGKEYSIVERSQLEKVMQEAKFNNSDAVDESQATELGRLAGADRVVLSVISQMGARSLISIKMINVETATIEKQQSKLVDSESLLDVIEPITLVILGQKDVTATNTSTATKKTVQNKVEQNGTKSYNVPSQPEELANGALLEMANANTVNVIFDLSNATFSGLSYNNFISVSAVEDKIDEETAKDLFDNEFRKSCILEFITNANKDLKNFKLTSNNPDTEYTLIVKVGDTESKSNVSDYLFVRTADLSPVAGVKITGKTGLFSIKFIKKKYKIESQSTILGISFSDSGKKLAEAVNDSFKIKQKKSDNKAKKSDDNSTPRQVFQSSFFKAQPQSDKFDEYSLEPISKAGLINVVYNFADASVDGLALESFFKVKELENPSFREEFNDGVQTGLDKFTAKVNERLKRVKLLGNQNDTEYTLVVRMSTIDEKGKTNVCDYIFINSQSKRIVGGIRLKAEGSGSKDFGKNMSKALESIGEKFSEEVEKEFKRIDKKNKN